MKSFGLGGISPKFWLGNLLSIARTSLPSGAVVMAAGGPNATGPWTGAPLAGGANNFGAFATGATNGGISYGSLSGASAVHGAPIVGLGDDDDGAQQKLCVILQTGGSVLQSFFTSVTFGAPISLTLTTATATQFNSNTARAGFTGWWWNVAGLPFFAGSNVNVSFT